MSNPLHELVLRPRDGLFVKDGRGWYTAGAGRAYGQDWPPPGTVLGALRTAYGRTQETAGPLRREDWARIRDEVALAGSLALRVPVGQTATPGHRLWPAPADALCLRDDQGAHQLLRLAPEPLPATVTTLGSEPDEPAREALWWPWLTAKGKPVPGPRWWTEDRFAAWLAGAPVAYQPPEDWPDPPRRVDVHVSINPDTAAAADGQLFSHDVLETLAVRDGQAHDWALACQARMPAGAQLAGRPVTLGGKRRLVNCEPCGSDLFGPPAGLLDTLAGQRRFRLVVVSPAHFGRGWLPDGLSAADGVYTGSLGPPGLPEVILRAAYVGRPLHVSGWDMAKHRPKPTLRLVPPGAVYFCELAGGAALTSEQAAALWWAALGRTTDEGYGRVVPGVWPEDGA